MSEPTRPAVGWWSGALKDAILLLFVAGLGVKAAYGGAGVRDVDLADEWAAVSSAAAVPARGLPSVDWSPLYILWDFGVIRSGAPLEDVPFYSWAVLAVLLPCAVYLLARSLGARRAAAVAASGFLLATTLIDVWPYSMHLTATILALGTALAARLPRAPALAVLGLSLLTVTYNRPEYLYALYLFAPLAVGATVFGLWRADSRRAVLGAVALFATGSALLVWALGSPRAEGGRPIIAFGQHYAYNQFLEGKGAENGSPWGQWENYIRADFGDATTVGGALRNNPGAFFWHVRTNAQRLPGALSLTATPRIDLSRLRHAHMFLNIPSRHPKSEALARRAVALVVGCGPVGVVIGLRRWRRDPGEASALPVGVLMLGFVAAPAVAAALLIFPRYHYGIPSVVFAVALAAAGFRYLPRPEWARTRTAERLALVAVVGALALFVPNRGERVVRSVAVVGAEGRAEDRTGSDSVPRFCARDPRTRPARGGRVPRPERGAVVLRGVRPDGR